MTLKTEFATLGAVLPAAGFAATHFGLGAGWTALGFTIFSSFGGTAGGVIVGSVLGVINLLCLFAPISQNGFFQGVIGWLNWIMPMSWPIVALGFLFYLISFLLWGVTAGKVEYLRVQGLGMEWKTGTFFMKGGLV